MWKDGLNDSEKLVVFLGGINAIRLKAREFEGLVKLPKETDRIKLMEEQAVFLEKRKKALNEMRSKIVELLNKSGEVKDISDMFDDQTPIRSELNPIMFSIHIPISLQKLIGNMPNKAKVEDFWVVYDGRFLMVSAKCAIQERPWGAYDVRNWFLLRLKEIIPEIEMTPPCLTHGGVVFVNNLESIQKSEGNDIYLATENKTSTVFEILQDLYLRLVPELGSFYWACDTCGEATEKVMEIQEHESNLISSLKGFLLATWKHPLGRRKMISQMKEESAIILEMLSSYSSSSVDLRKALSSIEENRAHNKLFDEFIEKVDLNEYTEPETVDPDAIIRVIEHVRSETEAYGSSVSTFTSTLVGAVIGSALTILLSVIVGFP